MSDVAEVQPAGKKLFVRQSSGLVREVSVRNALFFNTAAFVGTGVGWYPVFYALPFIAVGISGPFSTYGWAAIVVGIFCVFLALIFASLSSVMPRSGGDYVFTSRFIPKAGPFIAWIESFTLVFSSLAIIAFEVPIVLRNLQISGRIIGIGVGGSFFKDANTWFTSGGIIRNWPGFLSMLVVLALIFWLVIQPTKRFHRIVTGLAMLALASAVLMFLFGMIFFTQSTFTHNLHANFGVSQASLVKSANDNGLLRNGVDWAVPSFALMWAVLLFQYIGFQYSAYIAGEVRGNVKRGVLGAVLGALAIAVVMNSVYVDFLAKRLVFAGQVGWGGLFWLGDPHLPLGQPNSLPLMGAVVKPGLWPIWLVVSLGGTLFPFLLCPVYLIFISRVSLAWSLDRQVPEWFGEVNERVRAPLNAILAALAFSILLAAFQNFPLLPKGLTVAGDGRLSLVSTIWFGILMGALTWIMPGFNALLSPFTRKDLIRNAPWRAWLPVLGILWLVFALATYWWAGLKPLFSALGTQKSKLTYLNQQGVSFAIGVVIVAIIIYVIQMIRNRRAGVDLAMLYHEIPPD
ncbi:MAG TPA: APC family permease [Actinomycetota bacterium]|nr:APC family permease [Actinomycetota bacterium]